MPQVVLSAIPPQNERIFSENRIGVLFANTVIGIESIVKPVTTLLPYKTRNHDRQIQGITQIRGEILPS